MLGFPFDFFPGLASLSSGEELPSSSSLALYSISAYYVMRAGLMAAKLMIFTKLIIEAWSIIRNIG
jgi:hypothetical protein